VTNVPWFIHIAGDGFFALRVAQDEAVFGAVGVQPLTGRGLSIVVVDRTHIHGQAALVFRMAGTSGIAVRGGLSVSGNIAVVELCLIAVRTITADERDRMSGLRSICL